MAPTFVSLFSGCGGFDLGFQQAGYRCLGAFDINPLAVEVHRRNLKSNADVLDLARHYRTLRGLAPDVLLAGPPCQGFSTLGRREFSDPRNPLLVLVARIADVLRPKVLVVENVAGVVAGEHRHYWDRLATKLRRLGYAVAEQPCDAFDMGVPQHRRRMLMVAWKGQASDRLDFPVTLGRSVSEAIAGVRGLPNHVPARLNDDSPARLVAEHIRQGQKLSNVRAGSRIVHTWQIPAVFGRTTRLERTVLEAILRVRRQDRRRDFGDADPVSLRAVNRLVGFPTSVIVEGLIAKGYIRRVRDSYDLTHTFNGKFRRLKGSEPAPTVDTHFGDPRFFLHPTQDRGFTVREAARLQGFPDQFVFQGSDREQFRLVGNAVPPPMGKTIGTFIRTRILRTG